jgi:hypothetical protein
MTSTLLADIKELAEYNPVTNIAEVGNGLTWPTEASASSSPDSILTTATITTTSGEVHVEGARYNWDLQTNLDPAELGVSPLHHIIKRAKYAPTW